MSHYPNAAFLTSANARHQFLPDAGAEVAFAGRSNAGKSSAINAIVNRRQFARTSKTPGRTQLVNFFSLGDERRLVDLPGYGFAKVSDSMRAHWDKLLTDYFQSRDSLAGLILVVDIRRGLTAFDEQMIAFAGDLPVHVLLTKADKLKRGQAAKALLTARKALAGRASVQLFSALKRAGLEEARTVLDDWLGAAANSK
jgi:GTP-binding protein